jgi:hypothetical protein
VKQRLERGLASVDAQRPLATDLLDRAIDVAERVMPDLPMLGALLLIAVVCLVASGCDLTGSPAGADAGTDPQVTADLAWAVAPF